MVFGFALLAVGRRLQPRRRRPGPQLCHRFLLQRHYVFYPRSGRRHPARHPGARSLRPRVRHGLRLSRHGHQLPPRALPVVLAPRAQRLLARRPRRHAAHRRRIDPPQQRSARMATSRRSCTNGNTPPPICWRVTSPIPFSDSFAPSMTTSPGSPRSPPSSTPPRSARSGIDGSPDRQAQLTFAMARHAVVDLAQVYNTPPQDPPEPRLTPESLAILRSAARRGRHRLVPDSGNGTTPRPVA